MLDPIRWVVLLFAVLASGGCSLNRYVTDQAQVDALTYCKAVDGLTMERWGRVKREGQGVDWSHFSLGTFACRTQDEWLCRARTGEGSACFAPEGAKPDDSLASAVNLTDPQRRFVRNETQSEMLMQSDRLCDRYLASVFGTHAGLNLQMDVAGSLLSGGSAIANGIAARNLAAGAAMVGATKSHIDANVYQGQVATAINLVVRKNRDAMRETIRGNQACSPDAYTPVRAVQDALIYHNACSFEFGLGELVRDAASTRPNGAVAANELARLRDELDQMKTRAEAADPSEKPALEARIGALEELVRIHVAFGGAAPVQPASPQKVDGAGAPIARQSCG